MNLIWIFSFCVSLFLLAFKMEDAAAIMTQSSIDSVHLAIELCGIYVLWLGVLEIMERCGFLGKLSKVVSPFVNLFFKNESDEAKKMIATSMVANLVGLGNAATPSGIAAANLMNKSGNALTSNMGLFLVISSTSITLFPTTIIGVLGAAGCKSPFSIVLPLVATSVVSTAVGIFLHKIFVGRKK